MIILYDATIDCEADLRTVYEWAYGDFKTDERGRRIIGEDGLPTPINPIRFPLKGVTIVQHGSRVIISKPKPPEADFRLEELGRATLKRVSKGNKEIYQVSGLSMMLLRQNVDVEHAMVNFTVTRWSGEHLPNQKMQVVEA